jgi:hypothetical protein
MSPYTFKLCEGMNPNRFQCVLGVFWVGLITSDVGGFVRATLTALMNNSHLRSSQGESKVNI